jgi:hypothetical protein
MKNSGLEEILSKAFGGVAKMLSGKKFPQNVHALMMLTEEILCRIFFLYKNALLSYQDLMIVLETISKKKKTAKLWVDL